MANTTYKAKARIPVRSQRSTSEDVIIDTIRPGEEVVVTSKKTVLDIVYGRIGKGRFVILERLGKFTNFVEV